MSVQVGYHHPSMSDLSSSADLQTPFADSLFGPQLLLSGDYYAEHDDVTRGLTLFSGAEVGFTPLYATDKLVELPLHAAPSVFSQFDADCIPPALTDENRVHLAATSLVLPYAPCAAGNALLSFLRGNQLQYQINKVNQEKFTLRADAIVDGLCCNIKVRIYDDFHGSVMEVRRRSGDTVAFSKVFQKLREHLLGPVLGVPAADDSTFSSRTAPVLPYAEHVPTDEAIAPLLDMASHCQDVSFVAEVVAALSAIAAENGLAAEELRKPFAQEVFQNLRPIRDFGVAFPVSQLLSC